MEAIQVGMKGFKEKIAGELEEHFVLKTEFDVYKDDQTDLIATLDTKLKDTAKIEKVRNMLNNFQ